MRILIITDSLGLPRPTPEVVEYDETWCSLLKRRYETHQFSMGGATITKIFTQVEYLKMIKPDLVFLQSGIVDCAPRALTEYENYIINKYYITRRLFTKFSRTLIPLLRKRGRTYTSEAKYRKTLLQFKTAFKDKLIIIPILPPSKDYEIKLPGIRKNINNYNAILNNVFEKKRIDLSDITSDHIMSDHIHLNKKGHNYLANKIIELISHYAMEKSKTTTYENNYRKIKMSKK